MPYVGYGRAILFTALSLQSVLVPAFLNLSSTSFTIEAWICPTITITGDRGIFGQCQCSTCANQCLYLILRSARLYIGFTSNDLTGSTTLTIGVWYHIAFVYNYQTQQQILYVNGVQDAIKSNAAAYQGTNASIQIGSTQVYSTTNYFNGYIDNLNVTTQAKSATDVLRDGSLIAYYSFDLPNPSFDNGPNRLNGTLISTVPVPGRVNQAIRIISSAYFQVYGLYNVPYGVSNTRSFSISMWIYPTTGGSSTFVQLFSSTLANNVCANLLGIYSPVASGGQIFVQSSNGGPSLMTGPFVAQNTWTHIALTFSTTNGYTLYTNGIAFGATGLSVAFTTSPTFAYLFVGFYTSCNIANVNFAYLGSIDELYIYNRELIQADVTGLANP
jgi:archaellum component FlaF (FlaF/FlaG flagellin family)